MRTELELLNERLVKLKRIQEQCNHDWTEPIYDPERIKTNDKFASFEDIDRWSIICKKCGKKEYVYKKEEVKKI